LLRSLAKGEEITQDISTLENPAILGQLGQTYWSECLLGGQSNGTIQANHFTIEHVIFQNVFHQLGVIMGCS